MWPVCRYFLYPNRTGTNFGFCSKYQFWFLLNPYLQPYLLTCLVPRHNATGNPTSVSLVEKACDTATTLLKVTHNKLDEGQEKKKKFAVCVKGLDIPDDLTVRLAEWIELVAAMGVDKIFVYKYEVHPKIDKLLKHYHNNGKISLRSISLPGLK